MTLYIYWLKDSERLSKPNGGIPESTGRSREEERHQTGIAENVQSNLKVALWHLISPLSSRQVKNLK